MKRFLVPILGLLAFVLGALPAHATITFVQSDGAFTQTSSTTATQTETLTHTTTAGDNIAVWVAWKAATTTRTLTSVTATGCTFFQMTGNSTLVTNTVTPAPWKNGTNEAGEWMVGSHCPAISSIVVTLSGGAVFTVDVEEYGPNVLAFGLLAHATGTSTAPSGSIVTQDANNFVLVGTASLGNAGIPTSSVGNLRDAGRTGITSSDIAGAVCDATNASATTVTCTVTITSGTWLSESLEFRTVNPADPLLVQAKSTSTDAGVNTGGNGFVVNFPQVALSGNAIICAMAIQNGFTPITFADSTAGGFSPTNTWTIAKTISGTNNTAMIFYAKNVAAGTPGVVVNVTGTFATAQYDPHVKCVEKYHINDLDAGIVSGTADVAGPVVSAGSVTPSQANDLIFTFAGSDLDFTVATGPGGQSGAESSQITSNIVPGSGASLIDADGIFGEGFQDIQQGAAAAINPSIDVEESLNHNVVTAAFKTDSSGTAPPATGNGQAPHIDHEIAFVMLKNAAATRNVQIPADGNLISVNNTTSNGGTISVFDSHQNAYSQSVQVGSTLYETYAINAAVDVSQNLNITLGTGTTAGYEFVIQDIRGVKTTTPLCQTVTSGPTLQSSPFSNGQVISNIPTLTPCAANDLIIWSQQNGCGPIQLISSPSGAITDNVYFTGQTDGSSYNFGEGHGHYITVSTSSIHFDATMQNNISVGGSACVSGGVGTNSYTTAAWEFSPIPAAAGGSTLPRLLTLGVGE